MAHPFKSGVMVCACVILGATLPSLGQLQTAAPSPEHQKMGYFAGDWKLEGTMKISPNAPAGPFTSNEHGEWVSGGFFLETHSSMHSILGDVHGVSPGVQPGRQGLHLQRIQQPGRAPDGDRTRRGRYLDLEFRCAAKWSAREGTLYRGGSVSDCIYLQVRDSYSRRRVGYGHGRQGNPATIRRDAAVVAVDFDRF